MKQTAVEWLNKEIERLTTQAGIHISWQIMDDLIQQAKQMEKEQIIEAFEHVDFNIDDGLQYYNETFKSE